MSSQIILGKLTKKFAPPPILLCFWPPSCHLREFIEDLVHIFNLINFAAGCSIIDSRPDRSATLNQYIELVNWTCNFIEWIFKYIETGHWAWMLPAHVSITFPAHWYWTWVLIQVKPYHMTIWHFVSYKNRTILFVQPSRNLAIIIICHKNLLVSFSPCLSLWLL